MEINKQQASPLLKAKKENVSPLLKSKTVNIFQTNRSKTKKSSIKHSKNNNNKPKVKFAPPPELNFPKEKKNEMLFYVLKAYFLNFAVLIAYNFLHTLTLMCIGHSEEPVHMNAVHLGHVYMKFFGYHFCIGCLGAFDFLASESIREKNYDNLYKVFNQAKILAILCFLIFILPLCFNCNYILSFTGMNIALAEGAGRYVKISLFVMFTSILSFINVKFLGLLNKRSTILFINLMTLMIHVISCVTFINVFRMKETGAGLSMLISGIFNFTASSYFLHQSNPCEIKSTTDLDTESLSSTGFYYYVKIALPSGVFASLNNVLIDFAILSNAFLPVNHLSANVIYSNVSHLYLSALEASLGFFSQCIRMNFLIKDNKIRSSYLLKLSIIITGIISLILIVMTYLLSDKLAWLYVGSQNQDIIQKTCQLLLIKSIILPFEWSYQLIEKAITSISPQNFLPKFQVFFSILIFLPLSLILMFKLNFEYQAFVYIYLISSIFFTLVAALAYLVFLGIGRKS